MKISTVLLLIFLVLPGCRKPESPEEPKVQRKEKSVYMVIDDKVINEGDYFAVIDPVWWTGDIYDTFERYEASLSSFSKPQRLVYAMAWYDAEVNNGGHDQFFTNSTGIVWKDALEGFVAVGAVERANILKEAAKRMGGNPSFDQNERSDQIDKFRADFEDLDSKYYELKDDFEQKVNKYVKENRKDFYFKGAVTKPD
jgi:hypothetical protein